MVTHGRREIVRIMTISQLQEIITLTMEQPVAVQEIIHHSHITMELDIQYKLAPEVANTIQTAVGTRYMYRNAAIPMDGN